MGTAHDPWAILALERGADARTIKRRYAELLKGTRPEDDPEGFQLLRWAYEVLTRNDGHAVEPVPHAPAPAPQAEPELEPDAEPVVPYLRAAQHARARLDFATRVLGVEVPKLRPLNEVVAEIVALGQRRDLDAEAYRRELAGIHELENFESFERVEPVLLEQLAQHATVLPPAMRVLSEVFGWNRYATHDERIRSRYGHWLAEAVARAREFEFETQLENGPWLIPTPSGVARQRRILRGLRAPPRRFEGILASALYRTTLVQRTIERYRENYGAAAVREVFNHDCLMFWYRLSKAAPPNVDRLVVRLLQWLGWSCVGVAFIALVASSDPKGPEVVLQSVLIAAATSGVALVVVLLSFANALWLQTGAPRWRRFRTETQLRLYGRLDRSRRVWLALGAASGALIASTLAPWALLAIAPALWFYVDFRTLRPWVVGAVSAVPLAATFFVPEGAGLWALLLWALGTIWATEPNRGKAVVCVVLSMTVGRGLIESMLSDWSLDIDSIGLRSTIAGVAYMSAASAMGTHVERVLRREAWPTVIVGAATILVVVWVVVTVTLH